MNLNPPDSSPQNKVLAVLEAIEAAQYLISRNASHLINRVTAGLLSLFVSILICYSHHVLVFLRRQRNTQRPLLATSISTSSGSRRLWVFLKSSFVCKSYVMRFMFQPPGRFCTGTKTSECSASSKYRVDGLTVAASALWEQKEAWCWFTVLWRRFSVVSILIPAARYGGGTVQTLQQHGGHGGDHSLQLPGRLHGNDDIRTLFKDWSRCWRGLGRRRKRRRRTGDDVITGFSQSQDKSDYKRGSRL